MEWNLYAGKSLRTAVCLISLLQMINDEAKRREGATENIKNHMRSWREQMMFFLHTALCILGQFSECFSYAFC